ncbi:hypothetical protein ABK040_010990 [Willaertia magna]
MLSHLYKLLFNNQKLILSLTAITTTTLSLLYYYLKQKDNKKDQEVDPTNQLELVNYLKKKNFIQSKLIENTFLTVDRKYYTYSTLQNEKDLEYLKNPYLDSAFPITCNATISSPHIHATCLEILSEIFEKFNNNNNSNNTINCLDIGSGSGFISSCLAHMSQLCNLKSKILAIEHLDELVKLGIENCLKDEKSKQFVNNDNEEKDQCIYFKKGNAFNTNEIITQWNDICHLKKEEEELFDIIHFGAACPDIPKEYFPLLKPGGRIVCPVGQSDNHQSLYCITKRKDNLQIDIQFITKVHFVPLFKKSEEQLIYCNRTNPKLFNLNNDGNDNNGKERVIVLPYLHLCDSSITSYDKIKWETADDLKL